MTFHKFRKNISDKCSYSFDLLKKGIPAGISFRGIPNVHGFSSLLLAILHADVKGKNLPDEGLRGGMAE